jgi:anion-transporting  ArsA/GET3 family ATPase
MLNTPTPAPKQVLLRLPDDVAEKLARAVPARQRNRYIVNLLTQDFLAKQESESRMLTEAAKRMNELEAQYPELARESEEWVNAELTESVDVWDPDFDRATFEREFAEAQVARRKAKAKK